MKRVVVAAAMMAASFVLIAAPASAAPLDFGKQTWNILPPGQSGALPPDRHSTDQLRFYDRLTALFDGVTARDIPRTYKSARFFAPKGGPVVHPKRGLSIRTDRRWGVPHIQGRTRSDVYFGIGWATARDRGIFMETIRYPARFSIVDAPGYNALAIATGLRGFEPSRQTETFIRHEKQLLMKSGPRGRRIIRDVSAFVAGINAFNRKAKNGIKPWTYVDVTAVTGLLGQVFGAGGGNEVRSSMFLAAAAEPLRRGGGRHLARLPLGARSRDAHHHEQALPVRHGARREHAGLPRRRPGLHERLGGARRAGRAGEPEARVQRGADRPEPIGHGASAGRDGSAAGLLLPGALPRGRRSRWRDRRARRRPAGPPIRPDRPRARLRVERDVGQQRQRRPVPRGALQPGRHARHAQLDELHVQGRLPADEELLRRDAEGQREASPRGR